MLTPATAGTPVDVLGKITFIQPVAKPGAVQPLEPFIGHDKYGISEFNAGWLRTFGTYGGKLYIVLKDKSSSATPGVKFKGNNVQRFAAQEVAISYIMGSQLTTFTEPDQYKQPYVVATFPKPLGGSGFPARVFAIAP